MPKKRKQYRFIKAVAHGMKKELPKEPTAPKAPTVPEPKVSKPKGPKIELPKSPKNVRGTLIRSDGDGDYPTVGSDKKVVQREDRGKATPKPAQPKKPKLTPERLKEIASQQGVKTTFIRSEQDQVEDLLKAFERRDDYTLVDPREFYGALQTVNKRVLGWVKEASEGLEIGEARDWNLPVEGARLKIRKIAKDMYSGHIIDKAGDIEHLYDRLTLPALATQIMSVYEVYEAEEPHTLRSIHDELTSINAELKEKKRDPKALKARLHSLIDNLARIDQMAVDHQAKHIEAHNKLVDRTEGELNNIHAKLKTLQGAFNPPEVAPQPDVMTVRQAGRPGPCNDCDQPKCQCYVHLTKPTVEIEPTGKITIMFKSDWNPLDKTNFLKSMKYVMEKKNEAVEINHVNLASHVKDSPYRGTHKMVAHTLLPTESGAAGVAFSGVRGKDFNRGAHKEWALRQQKRGNQTHMSPDPDNEGRVYISAWRKKAKE